MDELQTEKIMEIIANAGNAKSLAMMALKSAKNAQYEEAEELLLQANESLSVAHNAQTHLLTHEARGEGFEVNLLTIHSQDHLMNAITFIDIVKEIIDILKDKCGN